MERQGSPLPGNSEERRDLWSGVGQCGPVSGLLFPSSLNPRAYETPVSVP